MRFDHYRQARIHRTTIISFTKEHHHKQRKTHDQKRHIAKVPDNLNKTQKIEKKD